MLIVDAQIHRWENGTPSAHHRQEPYSAAISTRSKPSAIGWVGRCLLKLKADAPGRNLKLSPVSPRPEKNSKRSHPCPSFPRRSW